MSGWNLAAEFIDNGISGSKERRPALDRLMAEARRRTSDTVAVFRFDRFARSVAHLARTLDEFRALGIEFVSLHEPVDTSTPMGRVMFHIAGAFAELEREIIRDRVKARLASARRRGKKLGQAPNDGRQRARPRAADSGPLSSHNRSAARSPQLHSPATERSSSDDVLRQP
jgi:DNA invertase Pin-like site-specific DNA recombinase